MKARKIIRRNLNQELKIGDIVMVIKSQNFVLIGTITTINRVLKKKAYGLLNYNGAFSRDALKKLDKAENLG